MYHNHLQLYWNLSDACGEGQIVELRLSWRLDELLYKQPNLIVWPIIFFVVFFCVFFF